MTTPIADLKLSSSAFPRPEAPAPRLRRRVGAVLAGVAAVVILSHACDAAMHASGVFPPFGQPMADGLFALALAYRSLFAVVGGFVTARLAPTRPMAHAMVLGSIGTLAGFGGVLACVNAGSELGPQWYAVLVMLGALPGSWLGARCAKA